MKMTERFSLRKKKVPKNRSSGPQVFGTKFVQSSTSNTIDQLV